MPDRILEKHPERCFRIPMTGPVRSLNLATAVGVVLYEALRRWGTAATTPRRPAPEPTLYQTVRNSLSFGALRDT